jgi:choline dehydrogenase-like flavoprotein
VFTRKKQYDAIIVGSGATGGWAAKTLAESGLEVLVLEAGPSHRAMNARYFYERVRRKAGFRVEKDKHELARRPIQAQCYAWQYQPRAFADDVNHPYATHDGKPFVWIRAHQEGGRLALPVHGLQFYRLSDRDFTAASRDGVGIDWPIRYADLAPYYDRVERFMNLTGNADDLPHLPNPVPGARVALNFGEQRLKSSIAKRWPDRTLIARRTGPAPIPILAARKTGRATIRTNAIAREITFDPKTNRASGVTWLEGGRERSATGRVVIVAASAIESARLLLNSKSPRFPDGLANSSGALGRYLMDHARLTGFRLRMPLKDSEVSPRMSWTYVPQFRNLGAPSPQFMRGYAYYVFMQGHQCSMSAYAEMLPRATNRVTIDPVLTDAWGIPAPRIECAHSDNEHALLRDADVECRDMMNEAGFEFEVAEPTLEAPGLAVHECGTARMGSDPTTSVLNSDNQAWDVKNLFVVDAACFPSQGVQNPTLTMMALALRASERLVESMKRRDL